MKVIATDLDGTLFYPKDKRNIIYQPNLFVLQNFVDKGGKLVLISGRSVDYCKKVIKKLDRPASIIGFNGSCIYQDDKYIEQNTIPNEEVKNIVNETFQAFKNFGTFIMTDKGVFVHLKTKSRFIRWISKVYYRGQREYAEKFYSDEKSFQEQLENGNIYKVLLFFGFSKRKMKKAREANKILRNTYENFEFSWSTCVIEITLKNCNKARALEDFVKINNINKEDVIVVGDSGNDICMFKSFYENSFCMGHSPKSVSKYARYTIDKYEDLSRYIY